MKKIMIMMFIVITAVALTGCDFQERTYFTAAKHNATYIDNNTISFDPYEVLELNYPNFKKHYNTEDKLKTPMSINEFLFDQKILTADEIDTFRENYLVELEYRFAHHGEIFESYEFTDENYVAKFEDPFDKFGETEGVKEIEYRIHFIDKKTKDRTDMINITGILELEPAPLGASEKTITLDRFEAYDLQDNIYMPYPIPVPAPAGEEDTETTEETEIEYYELEDLYTFEYLVNGKTEDQSFEEGTKGEYIITVIATEIVDETQPSPDTGSDDQGTDDDSGASGDWSAFDQKDNGITFLGNATKDHSVVKLADDWSGASSEGEETPAEDPAEEGASVTGEVYTITYKIIVK